MVELSGERDYLEGMGPLRLLHRGSRRRGHGKVGDLKDLECKTETIIYQE